MVQLRQQWESSSAGRDAKRFIDRLSLDSSRGHDAEMPTVAQVVNAVIAERSTFTRADIFEAAAGLVPAEVACENIYDRLEDLVDEVMNSGAAWTVTPERDRDFDPRMREGSQRFTAEPVVEEINRGIDLATAEVDRGVDASAITPVDGKLSVAQARAMRAVVSSNYRASVVVAPAGAGKTSSLKVARQAWEIAGKTVVGLAPTGKAADVMVGEAVAHESSTIARAFHNTGEMTSAQIADHLGWNKDTVVVVDEAGMVGNADAVRLLEVAAAADARVVFVGDPHQYAAVRARSGLLGTLAYELPDAVELTEVFRQRTAAERRVSKWLRDGDVALVEQATEWYAAEGRLHAGSVTAMLADVMDDWRHDVAQGKDTLLVAGDRDTVDALNRAAQKHLVDSGAVDAAGRGVKLNAGGVKQRGFVGDVVLTRRNDYELVTATGEPVRNGARSTNPRLLQAELLTT
ncbi:AAA family ATPase [Corynebacterium resistens]